MPASRIQAKGTATTGESLAFDSNVTAGSLLICSVRWAQQDVGSGFTGFQDNVNGAWTQLGTVNYTGDEHCRFFYFLGAGAGATTCSRVGVDPGSRFRMAIAEYSIPAGYALLGSPGAPAIQGNASSTNCNSSAITAPTGFDLLAIGVAVATDDRTFTAQSGWSAAATGGSRAFIQDDTTPVTGSIESIPTINTAAINAGGIALFGVATPTNVATLPSGTPSSDFTVTAVSNSNTTGHTVSAAAGSNRMALAIWLREGPSSSAWSYSSCTWGGQSGVKILEADNTANPGTSTIPRKIAVYRFLESQIAAVSGSTLTTATSDSATTQGLIICQFANVNQTTPLESILKAEESESYSVTPRSLALVNTANGFALWCVLWGNATTTTWEGLGGTGTPTELGDTQPFSAYTISAAYLTSTGSLTARAVPLNTSTLSQTMVGLAINPVGAGGAQVLPIFSYRWFLQ